jgi:hypothetical protein
MYVYNKRTDFRFFCCPDMLETAGSMIDKYAFSQKLNIQDNLQLFLPCAILCVTGIQLSLYLITN